jgi:hypothetical protein
MNHCTPEEQEAYDKVFTEAFAESKAETARKIILRLRQRGIRCQETFILLSILQWKFLTKLLHFRTNTYLQGVVIGRKE